MSEIPIIPVFRYELESSLDLLDRVSQIGKSAGQSIVSTSRLEEPERIAWAFLAVIEVVEYLRIAMLAAEAREPLVAESRYKEAVTLRDRAEEKAEKLEALLALQKAHTGRARTWATVWKKAAKKHYVERELKREGD